MKHEPLTRERNHVEESVDWFAEFAPEEPERGPVGRPESAKDGRPRPLLVPPPPPRNPIAAPPPSPRPREESVPQTALLTMRAAIGSIRSIKASSWPGRRIAIAGIAALAFVIGVVATAAAMWLLGRDADVRDANAAALLSRQAGSTPIGAPAAPPTVSPTVSPTPSATPVGATPRTPTVPAVVERATETAPPQAQEKRPPPVNTTIDRQIAAPSPNAALIGGSASSVQLPSALTTPIPLSAAPPAPTPTPTPTASPSTLRTAADPPAPPAPSDQTIQRTLISAVLERYRLAFSTLSVDGLGAIWRGADTKALARAFDQLETQTFEFDTCRIELYGELAEAACGGRARFVPKIGARAPRVETRQWTFRLVRAREGWIIDRIDSR